MYYEYEVEEWVGVPANRVYSGGVSEAVAEKLREELEGAVDPDLGMIIAVLESEVIGDGIVLPVPGDPNIYYLVRYKVLVFEPLIQEVVKGVVADAREQGLFIDIGPLDGFVFRNQVADEPVEYLPDRRGFRLQETGRIIEAGDPVRARITQISRSPRRTWIMRVGMTMRQPYLGKEEWIREGR